MILDDRIMYGFSMRILGQMVRLASAWATKQSTGILCSAPSLSIVKHNIGPVRGKSFMLGSLISKRLLTQCLVTLLWDVLWRARMRPQMLHCIQSIYYTNMVKVL